MDPTGPMEPEVRYQATVTVLIERFNGRDDLAKTVRAVVQDTDESLAAHSATAKALAGMKLSTTMQPFDPMTLCRATTPQTESDHGPR